MTRTAHSGVSCRGCLGGAGTRPPEVYPPVAGPEGGCRTGCRDSGLTTLEWLLITAAVASLAALAVVLVTAAVEDTGEQVSNSASRLAAAALTAFEVEDDAKAATAADFDSWADWETHFTRECSLIAVLYTEVEAVHSDFNRADGGTVFDADAASYAALADENPPDAMKAQVQCEVR